jgi:flavin reductase (DIM6/NTAB) family NADH-FMN oxidoreductase RutF
VNKHALKVSDLNPGEGYKIGTGLVVPRPIGWVGTRAADGSTNLAPFSFFNMVCAEPPMFLFAPARGGRKDTLANVRETGEFTLNIVTEEVAEAMNATAASLDHGVSEFEAAGLTAVDSVAINVPMVDECKANFECIVTQITDIGHAERGFALVIGEAVMMHVRDDIFDLETMRVDQANLKAVGRHAGNVYSRSTDQYEIERPA